MLACFRLILDRDIRMEQNSFFSEHLANFRGVPPLACCVQMQREIPRHSLQELLNARAVK